MVWSLLLVLLAPSVALATLPGEYLGEFEFPMHLVKGSLFSLSDKTLFIHRFYYDGQGPPGVIFVAVPQGENDYGKGIPLRVRESEFRPDLPEVLNKNLTLDLPGPLTVQDVGRLVVWCPEYGVSFGRVDLTEKPEKVPNLELEHVGPFIKTEHAVKGTVFIQDDETLVIHDFNYDGQGPSVVFYGGEEENLETGKFIQYPFKPYVGLLGPTKLKKMKSRDITLKLPKGLNARQLKWLSVWCDIFEVSFGHVVFD